MTNLSPMSRRQAMMTPVIPMGEIISTYDTYQNAQHAVDTLARADFPVNQVAIVGDDIRSVERVTGKVTWGRVALMGALSGMYLGLFLSLILLIVQPGAQFAGIFVSAIAIGAGFGMLFGLFTHGINRNRRDFASVMQLVAGRYDLVTEPELVHQARQTLISAASGK
ncbi:general stress protein [Leucobacter sp. UCMA 4100]|uniref:general stress protein n=1 Tax=Leucobacter sp. UCMA 4100 TaxID=2810534 RepID=UPI0022EAD078|nr:general stress protein [Leucobacter sp. UCMA 4100]